MPRVARLVFHSSLAPSKRLPIVQRTELSDAGLTLAIVFYHRYTLHLTGNERFSNRVRGRGCGRGEHEVSGPIFAGGDEGALGWDLGLAGADAGARVGGMLLLYFELGGSFGNLARRVGVGKGNKCRARCAKEKLLAGAGAAED